MTRRTVLSAVALVLVAYVATWLSLAAMGSVAP